MTTTPKRLIVLDAGHGGGAMAGGSSPNHATGPNGLMEKDVALDMALRLGSLLRAGADVVLTRREDRNLSLSARAQTARDRRRTCFSRCIWAETRVAFGFHPKPTPEAARLPGVYCEAFPD